jgi:hypothetical protein
MQFLEDARDRNVLRTVGPVYQFRHARLQDRLADQAFAARHDLGNPAKGPSCKGADRRGFTAILLTGRKSA